MNQLIEIGAVIAFWLPVAYVLALKTQEMFMKDMKDKSAIDMESGMVGDTNLEEVPV